MCLHVGELAKPIQNGDRPITCWKIVRYFERKGEYQPFYYWDRETYVDGSENCVFDEEYFREQKGEISVGFHSYVYEEDAMDRLRGIYSSKRYDEELRFCVLKCEIPKWGWYFEGEFNGCKCYCSNRLRIVGKIC